MFWVCNEVNEGENEGRKRKINSSFFVSHANLSPLVSCLCLFSLPAIDLDSFISFFCQNNSNATVLPYILSLVDKDEKRKRRKQTWDTKQTVERDNNNGLNGGKEFGTKKNDELFKKRIWWFFLYLENF